MEKKAEETLSFTIEDAHVIRSLKAEVAKIVTMKHFEQLCDLLETINHLFAMHLDKQTIEYQKSEFERVQNTYVELTESITHPVFYRVVEVLMRNSKEFLQHYAKQIKYSVDLIAQHIKDKNKKDASKELILLKKIFVIFHSILGEFCEALVNIRAIPLDDYFLQEEDSTAVKELALVTEQIIANPKNVCLESLKASEHRILGLIATVAKEAQRLPKTEEQIDSVVKKLTQKPVAVTGVFPIEFREKVDQKNRDQCDDLGLRFITRMKHFMSNRRKAAIDGKFSIAQGDHVMLRKIFNFAEKGIIKYFRKKMEYLDIENNLKIYIRDDLLDRFFAKQKHAPMKLKDTNLHFSNDELFGEDFIKKNPAACKIRFFSDLKFKRLASNLSKKLSAGALQDKPIIQIAAPGEARITSDFMPEKPWLEGEEERRHFDTVLVYLHGGGFTAMSSSSHQNYLRKWAKDLKIPIFAVDYRLAPFVQYPELPNDVIKSYVWVLAFLSQVLKVDTKRIIVSGDSAGGTLALVLTTWCIENKVRVPSKVVAHYPACDLNAKKFTPCMIYTLADFLLSYSGLRMCISYYLPVGCDPATDYYVSPLHTPVEILQRFPPTDFFICERDPLSDDGIRLASKMVQAGAADVRLFHFPFLVHGLLNMAIKREEGVKEALKYEEKACSVLKQFIDSK